VVWSVLDWAGAETDVSIADLAWFASYVLLCTALWTVLNQSRGDGRVDLDFVVDAVTILVVTLLVFWRVSVEAIVADTAETTLVRAAWAAYPILDAVLLALVLRVLMSPSARSAIDAWFAVGVGLWLTADIFYLLVPDQDTAVVLMIVAWMLAPALMVRATWRVPVVGPGPDPASATPLGWVPLLLIAVCPLVVPPAIELIADLSGQRDHPVQLLVGMVIVIALAFVRTGRLILSEQRAQRELEEARDKALAASEAKSMFLANMSHELRTPLTTVLASAELMEDTPLNDVQLQLLDKMQRSGRNLLSLVESILDFSRIEAGQVELREAQFDLNALVSDVVAAHLPQAGRQQMRLSWEIDPRVPCTVAGDRTRIFQVLDNLLVNALKFTEEGQVRLEVCPIDAVPGGPDRAGCTVQFSVTDTGIGIREEDQAAVFESFWQVDGSATRHYQGSGLGLAICRDLTERMGGTITVLSELNVGSTFTVQLPLTPVATDRGLVR
jgi:signal transduction histidine kinase